MAKDALRDKVGIVGVGCCAFGENWDQSPSDMIVDAAYEAYADAGIEKPQEEIDAVFCGSLYSQKGPHETSDALKLWKPVTEVSNYCATGTDAFRCGVMSVACGLYDTVLVVGYDKPKDRGVSGPSVMMNQVRDLPQTPAGWFSICASRLLRDVRREPRRPGQDRHQESPQWHAGAQLVSETRDHGRGLPQGADHLLALRPLRLCGADRRRGRRRDHPGRSGAQPSGRRRPREGCDRLRRPQPQKDPEMDFLAWKPTREAAEDAYAMAGVGPEAIDVAQVHDCFSLTELLSYEDLGFCEKGAAKEHIADGEFELGGRLPVNTDGGLKSFGHPTGATGVRMIYENVLQLQGRAGERQVPDASIALSHNIGGHPTACGIAILARD